MALSACNHHAQREKTMNLRITLLALCVFTLATGAARAQGTETNRMTPTVGLKLYGQDLCLETFGNTTGAPLQFVSCANNNRQRFALRQIAPGRHELRSVETGLCIDAPAGLARLQQYPCHSGPVQQWALGYSPWTRAVDVERRDHGFTLANVHTRRYIGESPQAFPLAEQTDEVTAAELELEVRSFADATTALYNTLEPQWAMTVPDGSVVLDQVIAAPFRTRPYQIFRLRTPAPRELEIRPEHSGQCLNVAGSPAQLSQSFGCAAQASQRFRMRFMGGDDFDVRTLDGRCVGLPANRSGTGVIAGDCAGVWSEWRLGNPRPAVEPPTLVAPAANATVLGTPTFSWSGGRFHDVYLLCAARPGVSCPTREMPRGASRDVITARTTNTWSRLDLNQFARTWVNWTVAGCREIDGRLQDCVYQQNFRPMYVEPRYDLVVTLERLEVRDDCDNVSDGEWRLATRATSSTGASNGAVWSSDSVVVGSYPLRLNTYGYNMTLAESLRVDVGVVDCDFNGIWNIFGAGGIGGVFSAFVNIAQTCGGEEAYEMSGGNDRVGEASRLLLPGEWSTQSMRFSLTGAQNDCSANPYTAHYVVTHTQR
jgi:hypothetical protein